MALNLTKIKVGFGGSWQICTDTRYLQVFAHCIVQIDHLCFCYLPSPENTRFLHKGKYHFTADLLLDLFGFGQTSKSVDWFNTTKQLNPNQSNRRWAIQWYFPLQSKRVCYLPSLSPAKCLAVEFTRKVLQDWPLKIQLILTLSRKIQTIHFI